MKRILAFLLLLLLGFFLAVNVVSALDLPEPTGYVSDRAEMLSSAFRTELETGLADFEQETTVEIAVVTVSNLQGTTIEDFAVQLFEKWGIGKADQDNGILLLIAQEERQIRIEVGYGLEPIITDGRAGRIIREQITPAFKKQDYDAGVRTAVNQLEDYIRSGQPPTAEEAVKETAGNNFPLIVVGLVVLIYLSAFWGRSKRVWPGGIMGGGLGAFLGWIGGGLSALIFTALGFGIIGLLLDILLSRNYQKLKKARKPTGFWSSRGGFFSGGSGGSSGGSSGGFGGGSSGGGGASGGW